MAGVIAAHKEIENLDYYTYGCRCGWKAQPAEDHPDHLAEELTKAGYGLVPDVSHEYGAPFMGHDGLTDEPSGHGPIRDPHWWQKSTHVRLVGPWRKLEPLPAPTAEEVSRAAGELQRLARWPKP